SGRGGRSHYITPIDWNGWEPRAGFAWTPGFGWNHSGRMVVRGGYGLSHAPLTGLGRNPSPDFAAGTSTYTFNTRVTASTYNGSRGVHLFLPPTNINAVPFALSEAYLGLGLNPLDNVNDPLGRRDPNGNLLTFSQGYLGTKHLGFEGLNTMLDARASSQYN